MFLQLLFPKFCIVCKRFGSYICHSCKKNIQPFLWESCPICYKQSTSGMVHNNCKKATHLDGVISVFQYAGTMKNVVSSIKYRLQTDVWNEVFDIFPTSVIGGIHTFKITHTQAYLQTIPLHSKRQKQRGFNQADPFMKYLSKQFSFKTTSILIRSKETQVQVREKSRENRHINMKDAFSVKKKTDTIDTIILVDDVYTTGSTCESAAKTLKQHGVKEVYVITLARG